VTFNYNLKLEKMKKTIISKIPMLCVLFAFLFVQNSLIAQTTHKKKKIIEAKAITQPSDTVGALARPQNEKNPRPESKSRGDVYGANYSDIVIDNFTGYTIDIYVDGSFRGTIAPYDKKVTWAVPGNTRLYAKAVFNDGSYIYWGPTVTYTGYEYTWRLNN
jgi:hypothetical protein